MGQLQQALRESARELETARAAGAELQTRVAELQAAAHAAHAAHGALGEERDAKAQEVREKERERERERKREREKEKNERESR